MPPEPQTDQAVAGRGEPQAVVIGLDLGTTSFKALSVDLAGRDVALARLVTPWRVVKGVPCLRSEDVLDTVARVLAGLGQSSPPVLAIGITGMAEAGFVLDAGGRAQTNAVAWHAPQGELQAVELRERFGRALPQHTGLQMPERCSAVKCRWLTAGQVCNGQSWANVPEWVAAQLGGSRVGELSLAARTGMLDVVTRRWWTETVAWAGLDRDAMPELVSAGTPLGRTTGDVSGIKGATVTIGGHDHLAASVGGGALGFEDAFDSFGTGEAVLRRLAPAAGAADLEVAVDAGFSRGPHVIPRSDYAMAALGSGRLLHEVLDRLAIAEADRAALDEAAATVDRTGVAKVSARLFDATGLKENPGTVPAPAAWRATLDFTARRCAAALDQMDGMYGQHARVYAAGGWYRSPSIRALRREIIGPLRIPLTAEAGARGAARFGALAAGLISGLDDWADPYLHQAAA